MQQPCIMSANLDSRNGARLLKKTVRITSKVGDSTNTLLLGSCSSPRVFEYSHEVTSQDFGHFV